MKSFLFPLLTIISLPTFANQLNDLKYFDDIGQEISVNGSDVFIYKDHQKNLISLIDTIIYNLLNSYSSEEIELAKINKKIILENNFIGPHIIDIHFTYTISTLKQDQITYQSFKTCFNPLLSDELKNIWKTYKTINSNDEPFEKELCEKYAKF